MDNEDYKFLERETNIRDEDNLEDTVDLKDQLKIVKEVLSDTIIADEDDLYGQD